MSLTPGTRIGPYEITGTLGHGGMGEVFRARDTHLGREVAIKVLPDLFARDAERLARFRREAQALAALNDPHIAQIYRLEELGDSVALVMEYVEGPTLAETIAAVTSRPGGMPGIELDDAIRLGAEIAAGLETAHEKGIIHRDLKPANVKITPDGRAKILDFGLAKALGSDLSGATDLMHSPTLTARATEAGVILGTAAYMSPEQARGKPVDKRTDIWAFGAVLFEMLSGRRAFEGDTVSDTLAAVLKTEPDWTQLPPNVPPYARALLRRCLERDASRRLRDIGEARVALQSGEAPPSGTTVGSGVASGITPAPMVPSSASRPWVWMAATGVCALAALFFAATPWLPFRSGAPAPGSYELAVTAPDGAEFQVGSNSGNVILSPDGTKIAFVAATAKAITIWVRSLATDDARSLSGTDGASYPFWSPDGRRIGFFANGKLRTVDIAGGLPESIADAPAGRGGSWGEDGTIIFTPIGGGTIVRVKATGGDVTPVTKLDLARGENAHYWPVYLPGGARFLYFIRSTRVENSGIYVGRLDGSAPAVRLMASLSSGILAERRSARELYLLWVRDGDLLAQRFDADAVALRGEASTIAHGVRVEESQRQTYASASRTGTLAWAAQRASRVVLALYDRAGRRVRALDIEPGDLAQPALSPDGQRLLFMRAEKGSADVFLHDLQTGTTQRITTDPDYDEQPTWSPDGSAMIHLGQAQGKRTLFRTVLNTGAQPSVLYSGNPNGPGFETPDGRYVIYTANNPQTGRDIMALPLTGDRVPVPLAAGAGDESVFSMSSDGRWLGIGVDRGGAPQALIVRLVRDGSKPALGAAFSLGVDASLGAAVRTDAREAFVVTSDRLLKSIPLTPLADALALGPSTTLFKLPDGDGTFSVSADGSRFVVVETPFAAGQTLRVLTNWEARLTK